MSAVRERYGEAFWRAHHEAWIQSELNQREYCEVMGFRSKRSAIGARSSKPSRQLPARKLPYRRGGLSQPLSHGLSQGLVMTYARLSHLHARVVVESLAKRINDKILQQAYMPDACFSDVARRYGIAERVLFLDEGWLLLTHGVGPVRKYSIGAALLDKNDPSKVLAARANRCCGRNRPSGKDTFPTSSIPAEPCGIMTRSFCLMRCRILSRISRPSRFRP